MRKKLLLFVALVGALVMASCSGGNKKQETLASPEDLKNAGQVVDYYHTALSVLKGMVQEKYVNAVLGYMEKGGKAPMMSAIAPPAVSAKDTALLMNPGEYFDVTTQENLVHSFEVLFEARNQFYATFDNYLALIKTKKIAEASKLLNVNYDLSLKMAEYKQNIFDILSSPTEQAEQLLLSDEPMKDQMIAVRTMAATMQNILNLYARPHVMEETRLNMKMEDLRKELEAAKKLPAVKGHEQEVQSYQGFLDNVEKFLKSMQIAINKGNYNEDVYDALISEYGISLI